jgi:hypothetical protein
MISGEPENEVRNDAAVVLSRSLRARDAQSRFKNADETIMATAKKFEEYYPDDAAWQADYAIWERNMSQMDNLMQQCDSRHKSFQDIRVRDFKGDAPPLQNGITSNAKRLYGAVWIAQRNYSDRRNGILHNFFIESKLPQ